MGSDVNLHPYTMGLNTTNSVAMDWKGVFFGRVDLGTPGDETAFAASVGGWVKVTWNRRLEVRRCRLTSG